MQWPVPLGVRVQSNFKLQFLAQLADCTPESQSIDDFPEYEHELSAAQKLQLRAIAEKIVFSQKINPIAAIAVVGHADRAQRLQGAAATKKEQEVSQNRADTGKRELLKMLRSLPDGTDTAEKVAANSQAIGKGATKLIVPWPRNEAEMRKNRRVEFVWARCRPQPVIHPAIEFPPRPAPDERDDPNVVFAGQRFRSKIIEGASAAMGVGFITLTMAIWDVDNSRLAGYDYNAGIVGGGVNPIPFINETDWSAVFTTPVPLQVDQFGGAASHRFTSAALSFFTMISKMPDISPRNWPLTGQAIGQWTGFSASLALETSNGNLSLIPNTVRVFKGP
jgi:outer membrane protein OmpA-like peptidoglycan-associated protein